MPADKTAVDIKLTTEIFDLGQKDVTVVEETGSYIRKGNTAVLTFTEHQEQGEDIQALITIQPEKVSVKRTGAVHMHQVFRKKQKTENVYRHEFGTMHMETHTDQILFKALQEGKHGELFISYTTKMNGEGKRRHRLTLGFQLAR
ncbi:DUF1934 domain-containing protein [Sediminibacillus halophilus]|uniref:Uncharacterized beta-barrel protein YwiB, DUF1934 family n=1 Tax=Sediminibacillus halophilus TaxID=482461 RepID=A0A1G9TWI9_9BACI|nr:DUF1934 domain-containing protein [Sediminibacillus halophilus]SDM52067.1 Uncharacterized beta-barrel protein YwiB, DUF1934 family [Sediminibacillus halophilus]